MRPTPIVDAVESEVRENVMLGSEYVFDSFREMERDFAALKERVTRLEEAGDAMEHELSELPADAFYHMLVKQWKKAKQ